MPFPEPAECETKPGPIGDSGSGNSGLFLGGGALILGIFAIILIIWFLKKKGKLPFQKARAREDAPKISGVKQRIIGKIKKLSANKFSDIALIKKIHRYLPAKNEPKTLREAIKRVYLSKNLDWLKYLDESLDKELAKLNGKNNKKNGKSPAAESDTIVSENTDLRLSLEKKLKSPDYKQFRDYIEDSLVVVDALINENNAAKANEIIQKTEAELSEMLKVIDKVRKAMEKIEPSRQKDIQQKLSKTQFAPKDIVDLVKITNEHLDSAGMSSHKLEKPKLEQ